jgi:NitT/TauT family transport system substrate-binding protein
MKLAVPDMISNSYFPAIAAIELGFFKQAGLDVELELISPVDKTYAALREGTIELVGGSAHSALAAFPDWQGVRQLCAQAQGTYWFLVMRKDLGIARGDLAAIKGRKIGAAPWVDMALRRLLIAAGLDPENNGITIAPVPGAAGVRVNFGVTAARAMADGKIDGFWANGMGTEVAVRNGTGTVVLDVRRGDGPPLCFDFTFASIATSERVIARHPGIEAAVTQAIKHTHAALQDDLSLATRIGRKLFPPAEAELIAELIRRDLPYYDTAISRRTFEGMSRFARDLGILAADVPYEQVISTAAMAA